MVGAPERRGVRRGIALTSTIAVVLAVVLLAAGIVALSVGELVVQIPTYETRLSAALAGLRDQVARLGMPVDPAAISTVVSPERIFAFVQPVASAVSDAGGSILIVAFTVIYALAGGRRSGRGSSRPSASTTRWSAAWRSSGATCGATSSSERSSVCSPRCSRWCCCWRSACRSDPVGRPRVLRKLHPEHRRLHRGHPADDPGVPRRRARRAAMVIVGYAVINFVQDQFLQPVVMGSQLNLSPLVVFIALVAWA